jgi:hypothetical protein
VLLEKEEQLRRERLRCGRDGVSVRRGLASPLRASRAQMQKNGAPSIQAKSECHARDGLGTGRVRAGAYGEAGETHMASGGSALVGGLTCLAG